MTPFICSWYDQLKLRTFKYGQLFSNPLLLLNNLEEWNNMYWIQKWDKIKNINKHKNIRKDVEISLRMIKIIKNF